MRNDNATTTCDACGTGFTPVGRQRWCSDACRQAAWRRRRSAPRPALPARTTTVYQCPECEARYLGEQRCDQCNRWCRKLGAGAACPHCDEVVAITDILTENQITRPDTPRKRHTRPV
ncbi:MAG: hypothetical protein ACRDZ7_00020 [Acidimicrobiia bacterium]